MCRQHHTELPLLQLCSWYVVCRGNVSPVLLLLHKARECCLLPQVGDSTQCCGREPHLDLSCRRSQALHRGSLPAVTSSSG